MDIFHRKPKKKKSFRERWKGRVGAYAAPMKDGASIIRESWSSILQTLRKRPERDAEREQRMRVDFTLVLEWWGVEPTQVNYVVRGLKIGSIGWALLACLCLVWAGFGAYRWDWTSVALGIASSLMCLAIASTRRWRWTVLTRHQFAPYTEWLGFRPRPKG